MIWFASLMFWCQGVKRTCVSMYLCSSATHVDSLDTLSCLSCYFCRCCHRRCSQWCLLITLTQCSLLKTYSQAAATSSTAASSSIFGAAKPREEVLQSKGIDPKAVEKRVEKKASIVRFTGECIENKVLDVCWAFRSFVKRSAWFQSSLLWTDAVFPVYVGDCC